MRDQGVNEGAVGIAGGGMDDEPGRLVDDDDMCILEADVEGQRLCWRLRRLSSRDNDRKVLAGPHTLRRVARERILLPHVPLFDQPLEAAARQVRQAACQHAIEALPGFAVIDPDPRRLAGAGIGRHGRRAASGPLGERPVRALTVFVVVMGVIIVVGFGVVAAVIAGRMAHGGAPAAGVMQPFRTTAIDIPKGARVEAMTASPDRLVVDLLLPDGERRLVIIDLASGARVGTIELHPTP
jgi:hypothetical protein